MAYHRMEKSKEETEQILKTEENKRRIGEGWNCRYDKAKKSTREDLRKHSS